MATEPLDVSRETSGQWSGGVSPPSKGEANAPHLVRSAYAGSAVRPTAAGRRRSGLSHGAAACRRNPDWCALQAADSEPDSAFPLAAARSLSPSSGGEGRGEGGVRQGLSRIYEGDRYAHSQRRREFRRGRTRDTPPSLSPEEGERESLAKRQSFFDRLGLGLWRLGRLPATRLAPRVPLWAHASPVKSYGAPMGCFT
jgi:hypothetical protein